MIDLDQLTALMQTLFGEQAVVYEDCDDNEIMISTGHKRLGNTSHLIPVGYDGRRRLASQNSHYEIVKAGIEAKKTLQEIADECGVTRQRVSQIKNKILTGDPYVNADYLMLRKGFRGPKPPKPPKPEHLKKKNIHGEVCCYVHGCRCDLCKAANSQRQLLERHRRKDKPIPDRVHGTPGGYGNWSCRCKDCSFAHKLVCQANAARRKKEAQLLKENNG